MRTTVVNKRAGPAVHAVALYKVADEYSADYLAKIINAKRFSNHATRRRYVAQHTIAVENCLVPQRACDLTGR
ncbi:MAG: hypothetical protein ND866_32430 [Pyrinomonadaceae bacterium]|nr:hypothetical protein [Pyrinomonadaceae bacterium]